MQLGSIERKVQLTGKSTFTVSLPKDWASDIGLKQGDIILITRLPDGSLRLFPKKEPIEIMKSESVQTLIIEKGEEGAVERLMIAYYAAGYNFVRVLQYPVMSDILRNMIRKAVTRLAGFEIIEETSSEIKVQNILDPKTITIYRTIERIEILTRAMLEDFKKVASKYDKTLLKGIIERDNEVDKFFFLLLRQTTLSIRYPMLSRDMGLESPVLALPLRTYGRVLEELADTLVSLARYHYENPIPIKRDITVLARAFKNALKSFRGNLKAQKLVSQIYQQYFSKPRVNYETYNILIGRFLTLCLKAAEAGIEKEALRSIIES
ncbi:MAG: hypothetical protein DRP08_07030 [Candidatus Aenigmatarchaeota archaeon]|nr:MAG: hypothetical protein DRP08_07030 [Candidatus Aenigmarchaeota archaeon]